MNIRIHSLDCQMNCNPDPNEDGTAKTIRYGHARRARISAEELWVAMRDENAPHWQMHCEDRGEARWLNDALFGWETKGIQPAVQVSHSLGVNPLHRELDYWIPVDDLTGEEHPELMQTNEINSSIYYKYVVLDYLRLLENLDGDKEAAATAVRVLIDATRYPKPNTVPAYDGDTALPLAPPFFTLVEVSGNNQSMSYAKAFHDPVYPLSSEQAVACLNDFINQVDAKSNVLLHRAYLQNTVFSHLDNAEPVEDVPALLDWAVEKVQEVDHARGNWEIEVPQTDANTLFLRLEGPLQSWGERDEGQPTKHEVIDLLARALGQERGQVQALSERVKMGVRVDAVGELMADVYMAGEKYEFSPRTDSTGRSLIKQRNGSISGYLSDASFLVALQAEPKLIHQLAHAVQNPAAPLYLGRECNLPDEPVYAGTGNFDSIEAAL